MKIKTSIILIIAISLFSFCTQKSETIKTNNVYYDVTENDLNSETALIAVTDEEFLEFGARVGYVDTEGDTAIPIGSFAYFGTDTLHYYANVIKQATDTTPEKYLAIDKNQHVLFDLVLYDNGPDYFNEGLIRVSRNNKMGFANQYGQVVIPCVYDFAHGFENGQAKVTFNATIQTDADEHKQVISDEWFFIDKTGKTIE